MTRPYAALRWLGHQDWIRFGIRNRILRLLMNPDQARPREFQVDYFGLDYSGNLNNYIDWMLYFFGAYEKQTLFLLRDLIRETAGGVFLDIGAYIGVHSLFMSRHAALVHAFEPYAVVRSSLERNIALNGLENIIVHPVGLGNRKEELQYFAPAGFNQGTGSFVPSHETANNRAFDRLSVVQGDEYVAGQAIKRIDVVKIDVEGFEKNVLTGLRNTLAASRPAIFMEYSALTRDTIGSLADFRAILPEAYRIRRFNSDGAGYRLTEFDFDVAGGDILLTPEG